MELSAGQRSWQCLSPRGMQTLGCCMLTLWSREPLPHRLQHVLWSGTMLDQICPPKATIYQLLPLLGRSLGMSPNP